MFKVDCFKNSLLLHHCLSIPDDFLSKYTNILQIVNILFFQSKTCVRRVRRVSNYQSNDDNKIHRVRKQPSWHLPLTWLPIILYICICGKVIHIPIRIFYATAPLVLLESVKSSVEWNGWCVCVRACVCVLFMNCHCVCASKYRQCDCLRILKIFRVFIICIQTSIRKKCRKFINV